MAKAVSAEDPRITIDNYGMLLLSGPCQLRLHCIQAAATSAGGAQLTRGVDIIKRADQFQAYILTGETPEEGIRG